MISCGDQSPYETAPNQGYYEHAVLNRDDEVEPNVFPARTARIGRMFRFVAGILAAALVIGLFVWLLIGWQHSP